MKRFWCVLAICGVSLLSTAQASSSPVTVEIIGPDGRLFREIPVNARDGALRSYLQAEKGAHYQVRVRNVSGERLGLVIAVDGRNIINGKKSDLARSEPMYVLDAWSTQDYAGWRANLEAINEFYFTDWNDSYAEAFGDRSARGVIALAVYREAPLPPVYEPNRYHPEGSSDSAAVPAPPPSARADRALEKSAGGQSRGESAGTGYGDRRVDHAVRVEFVARHQAARHFIKYEWRDTLCRKQVIDCGEKNRFWDESTLGFAPPPPRR
jgi:hypothetical protein